MTHTNSRFREAMDECFLFLYIYICSHIAGSNTLYISPEPS